MLRSSLRDDPSLECVGGRLRAYKALETFEKVKRGSAGVVPWDSDGLECLQTLGEDDVRQDSE